MIDEILVQNVQDKQPTTPRTALATKRRSAFTPARFSVGRFRKHPGIQTGRTPIIIQ